MKTDNRGGARENAGAPLLMDEPQTKRSVNLSDWFCKYAETIGENRSDGIRIALQEHYERNKDKSA